MPTISWFYGVAIRMFYNDHSPPHFHAEYGEHELIVAVGPIRIMAGRAPQRVVSMVLEWAALNEQALLDDWNLARNQEPLKPVPPLE